MSFGSNILGKAARSLALVAILAVGACAANKELPPATEAQSASEPLYKIGPGDSLTIVPDDVTDHRHRLREKDRHGKNPFTGRYR